MIETSIFSSIKKLAAEFHENAFSFLFKRDLQAMFFSELRQRLPEKILVPKTGGGYYDLNSVYMNYLNKIDLCCLDASKIEQIKPGDLKQHNGYDTYIYDLPVHTGIEMKYFWMGAKSAHVDVLKADRDKLTNDPITKDKIRNWMVMGFFQRSNEFDNFRKSIKSIQLEKINSIKKLNRIYIISPDDLYVYKY